MFIFWINTAQMEEGNGAGLAGEGQSCHQGKGQSTFFQAKTPQMTSHSESGSVQFYTQLIVKRFFSSVP